MENISIRKVKPSEAQQLRQIAMATFIATYGAHNSAANMERYLAQNFSLEQVTRELENPECEFFFAELSGKVVGYIKLNQGTAQTETVLDHSIEIERIYIIKEYQGKNLGRKLLDRVKELAKKRRIKTIWLGVWENNPKAIGFYEKNGFVTFDKHVFKLGEEDQTDFLMKFELVP